MRSPALTETTGSMSRSNTIWTNVRSTRCMRRRSPSRRRGARVPPPVRLRGRLEAFDGSTQDPGPDLAPVLPRQATIDHGGDAGPQHPEHVDPGRRAAEHEEGDAELGVLSHRDV